MIATVTSIAAVAAEFCKLNGSVRESQTTHFMFFGALRRFGGQKNKRTGSIFTSRSCCICLTLDQQLMVSLRRRDISTLEFFIERVMKVGGLEWSGRLGVAVPFFFWKIPNYRK